MAKLTVWVNRKTIMEHATEGMVVAVFILELPVEMRQGP
jgi:hypothetical protein